MLKANVDLEVVLLDFGCMEVDGMVIDVVDKFGFVYELT
jgi:hypothetical protein